MSASKTAAITQARRGATALLPQTGPTTPPGAASPPTGSLRGPPITPARAISPGGLLAFDFADGPGGHSWDRWIAVLKAAWAEPMTEAEIALFREVAGDRDPPTQPVKELHLVCGRRAGKDSIAAAIATIAALGDFGPWLRTGEKATIMCLASDKTQAQIVHKYISGYFRDIPALAPLVIRDVAETLELANNVELVTIAANIKAPRGRSIAVAILDEVAFWRGSDSAVPDTEVWAAIEPAAMTIPTSLLITISSPYRRSGLLYAKWVKHFGVDDPNVLVIHATSKQMNPTLSDRVIEARLAEDPDAGGSEYLAQWRSDIGSFIDAELLKSVVDTGIAVRPYHPGAEYLAFVDSSGGRGSSFCAAIAHNEAGTVIIDNLYEKRAPFQPDLAVAEVAALCREYRIGTVTGDRYSGAWLVDSLKANGIVYATSDKDKSALFLDALPLFTTGRIALLDNHRSIHQLSQLERVTSRTGRDRIAASGGWATADDLANCIAGVATMCAENGPALVKYSSVFAHACETPTFSEAVISVSVMSPEDGMLATVYLSTHPATHLLDPPPLCLLDAELTPLTASSIPHIFARLEYVQNSLKCPAFCRLAWMPSCLETSINMAGFEADYYDNDHGTNLVATDLFNMSVKFSTHLNAGRFRIAKTAAALASQIPLAAAFTLRPKLTDPSPLGLAILYASHLALPHD